MTHPPLEWPEAAVVITVIVCATVLLSQFAKWLADRWDGPIRPR